MTKRTTTVRDISIRGARYDALARLAARKGVTVRSLVEPGLVAMLDARDATQAADDVAYPPTPTRVARDRRRYNRPVPGRR